MRFITKTVLWLVACSTCVVTSPRHAVAASTPYAIVDAASDAEAKRIEDEFLARNPDVAWDEAYGVQIDPYSRIVSFATASFADRNGADPGEEPAIQVAKAFLKRNQDLLGLLDETLAALQYSYQPSGSLGNVFAESPGQITYPGLAAFKDFTYNIYIEMRVGGSEVTHVMSRNGRLPVPAGLATTASLTGSDQIITRQLIGRTLYCPDADRGPYPVHIVAAPELGQASEDFTAVLLDGSRLWLGLALKVPVLYASQTWDYTFSAVTGELVHEESCHQ